MDPKSQPSLPDQPAPQRDALPPDAPAAGAPPEWDAMPPSAPAPAPAKWGGRAKYVVIAVFAVIVIIAGVVVVVTLRSAAGNVYFSKSTYDTSLGTCQFDSPVTTVSTSDPVYLVAAFNDALKAQDDYTLEILKDGVSLNTTSEKASTSFSCYVEQNSLGPLSAGVYTFTFKHNDKIEAEGTLTVK
jgi:hypothetical protein